MLHWGPLPSMDGNCVTSAADDALSKVENTKKAIIQTDNGSGYIGREFRMVLAERGIGHHCIRPHTPEGNSPAERTHRTVEEALDE